VATARPAAEIAAAQASAARPAAEIAAAQASAARPAAEIATAQAPAARPNAHTAHTAHNTQPHNARPHTARPPVAPTAHNARPPAAAIASAAPEATRAGEEILRAGGNAFDAAVAVAAALGVAEPTSSGLGGGGFFLLHRASDGRQWLLDARERAPLAARAEDYATGDGRATLDGPRAAAIPGLPAALVHLARRYGRLPLARSLAPAIRLARQGVPVTAAYLRLVEGRLPVLRSSPAAAAIFLRDGAPPALGEPLRQPDLARTLRALAQRGAAGFYRGPVARRLVAGVRAAGGDWTLADLARYRVVERRPVIGHYRGYRVVSAAPPSSGGVVLLMALQCLEGLPPAGEAVAALHQRLECLRRAYRDRAAYLGDPDFVAVPVAGLLAPAHGAAASASIRMDAATPSASLPPLDDGPPPQGDHTSHFSILDRAGNRVAATLSINLPFGAGFVPPGTGVLLNDEMDDFTTSPTAANAYGLVGRAANGIAPGKRPLSSMTPTFLEGPLAGPLDPRRRAGDAGDVAILGTPGGSRIISQVLGAVECLVGGRTVAECVAEPRIHHQYLPDEVSFEPGALPPATQAGLARLGHRLKELPRPYGNMQAIRWARAARRVEAASDPRGGGLAVVR
jgi:gamma-glutamyltranspeptidase/glutathione hydrolase